MGEDSKKRKVTKTHVKPHRRSNPKNPGKHHVKGHYRKTGEKTNVREHWREVGGSDIKSSKDFDEQWHIYYDWMRNLTTEHAQPYARSVLQATSLGWREQQEIEDILSEIDTTDEKIDFIQEMEAWVSSEQVDNSEDLMEWLSYESMNDYKEISDDYENQKEIYKGWMANLTHEQREKFASATLNALSLGWREQEEIEKLLDSVETGEHREKIRNELGYMEA